MTSLVNFTNLMETKLNYEVFNLSNFLVFYLQVNQYERSIFSFKVEKITNKNLKNLGTIIVYNWSEIILKGCCTSKCFKTISKKIKTLSCLTTHTTNKKLIFNKKPQAIFNINII